MATEWGHEPNRVYIDQDGNLHLNGAQFFNDNEDDIAPTLEDLGSGALQANDDALIAIGTSSDARFSWDTTDANANELLLQLPAQAG